MDYFEGLILKIHGPWVLLNNCSIWSNIPLITEKGITCAVYFGDICKNLIIIAHACSTWDKFGVLFQSSVHFNFLKE